MTTTQTPLPFRCVLAVGDALTHLVAVSPALRGTGADEIPPASLCGRATRAEAAEHPADVQCRRCLNRAPQFMGLPAYEVTP